jgi:hypothetical protein
MLSNKEHPDIHKLGEPHLKAEWGIVDGLDRAELIQLLAKEKDVLVENNSRIKAELSERPQPVSIIKQPTGRNRILESDYQSYLTDQLREKGSEAQLVGKNKDSFLNLSVPLSSKR